MVFTNILKLMSVTGMNVKVYAVFKTKCINIGLEKKNLLL